MKAIARRQRDAQRSNGAQNMPNYLEKADDAAAIIAGAQRIMIVGCSGGGKSTLSRKLVRRFGLEYISMDREIFWLPGWQLRPRAEQRERIADFVAGERWLMDGSNPSSFDLRLPRYRDLGSHAALALSLGCHQPNRERLRQGATGNGAGLP